MRWRVSSGRLYRVHRGVYALSGASLDQNARWMAATLACGAGSVLSHRSAAELWGLLRPAGGIVEVSVPGQGGRSPRNGIRVCRRRSFPAERTTRRLGIPVTTPAATIGDLRSTVSSGELRRAIREAEVSGFPLDDEAETDRTRSELESLFLAFARGTAFPGRRSMSRSARGLSISSGGTGAWWWKRTATATTAAVRRSSTTVTAT